MMQLLLRQQGHHNTNFSKGVFTISHLVNLYNWYVNPFILNTNIKYFEIKYWDKEFTILMIYFDSKSGNVKKLVNIYK